MTLQSEINAAIDEWLGETTSDLRREAARARCVIKYACEPCERLTGWELRWYAMHNVKLRIIDTGHPTHVLVGVE